MSLLYVIGGVLRLAQFDYGLFDVVPRFLSVYVPAGAVKMLVLI